MQLVAPCWGFLDCACHVHVQQLLRPSKKPPIRMGGFFEDLGTAQDHRHLLCACWGVGFNRPYGKGTGGGMVVGYGTVDLWAWQDVLPCLFGGRSCNLKQRVSLCSGGWEGLGCQLASCWSCQLVPAASAGQCVGQLLGPSWQRTFHRWCVGGFQEDPSTAQQHHHLLSAVALLSHLGAWCSSLLCTATATVHRAR